MPPPRVALGTTAPPFRRGGVAPTIVATVASLGGAAVTAPVTGSTPHVLTPSPCSVCRGSLPLMVVARLLLGAFSRPRPATATAFLAHPTLRLHTLPFPFLLPGLLLLPLFCLLLLPLCLQLRLLLLLFL